MSSAWSASAAPETRLRRSASSHPATGASDEPSPTPSPSPLATPVLCREQEPGERQRLEKNAGQNLAAGVTSASGGEETGRSERRWDAGQGGRRARAMAARVVSATNREHIACVRSGLGAGGCDMRGGWNSTATF
jgi:hypothetical protein